MNSTDNKLDFEAIRRAVLRESGVLLDLNDPVVATALIFREINQPLLAEMTALNAGVAAMRAEIDNIVVTHADKVHEAGSKITKDLGESLAKMSAVLDGLHGRVEKFAEDATAKAVNARLEGAVGFAAQAAVQKAMTAPAMAAAVSEVLMSPAFIAAFVDRVQQISDQRHPESV